MLRFRFRDFRLRDEASRDGPGLSLRVFVSEPRARPGARQLRRRGLHERSPARRPGRASSTPPARAPSPRAASRWPRRGFGRARVQPALRRGVGQPRVRRARPRQLRAGAPRFSSGRAMLNQDIPAPHHALGVLADDEGQRRRGRARLPRGAQGRSGVRARSREPRAPALRARPVRERARAVRAPRRGGARARSKGGWAMPKRCVNSGARAQAEEPSPAAHDRFGDAPPLRLLVAREPGRTGRVARGRVAPRAARRRGRSSVRGAAWSWIAVARSASATRRGAQRSRARRARHRSGRRRRPLRPRLDSRPDAAARVGLLQIRRRTGAGRGRRSIGEDSGVAPVSP